jgi:glycosyltransferase involved in cell wall biosynthesis
VVASAQAGPPKVTVIIATYNWSSVLRYSIPSVLEQTFTDFELFVIGDGCTDDSEEVVKSFDDPRVRWHNLPENVGNQYGPHNAGIEMARGEYIAYLGHDDLWLSYHLELLVNKLDQTGAALAHSLVMMIGPRATGLRMLMGPSATGRYARGTPIVPTSQMHRRDVVQKLGGWRDYRTIHLPTDQDIILRVWDESHHIETVKRITAMKFPAIWRKDSYKKKPSDEQAAYWRRLHANRREVLLTELAALTASFLKGKHRDPEFRMPEPPPGAPPGWIVEFWRQFRGVDAMPLTEKDSEEAGPQWAEIRHQWTHADNFRLVLHYGPALLWQAISG